MLADLILGHSPVAAVEWDRFCCDVLRERAADGWFPGLQVHEGDIRLFDPSEYAGRVDCIAAGFPCQDISHAGNRAGIAEGTRSGLWSEVVRVARIVRPAHLFLENVAAIVGLGLDTVLADIAELGFDARWCCLRASDAGAPHQRDRWWLYGYANEQSESTLTLNGEASGVRDVADEQWRCCWCGANADECACTDDPGDVPDTEHERLEGQREEWTAPRPANGSRDERDPAWWQIEPGVGRVADGMASRVDRLKALGNGQVPQQAALAWRILTG